MATEIVETIGSGGDYTDIQSWLDGTANDLVSNDEIRTGKIIDDTTIDGRWNPSGATTDTDHYRKLTVDRSIRHYGNLGIGPAINPSTDGHVFTVDEPHFRFEWLRITDWSASSSEAFRVNVQGVKIEYSIGHDSAVDNQQDFVYMGSNGATADVNVCVMHNISRMAAHIQSGSDKEVYCRHVTAYQTSQIDGNGYYGGVGYDRFDDRTYGSGNVFECHNCVVMAPGVNVDDECYSQDGSTPTITGDYNISSDGTAVGSNSITNESATNVWQDPSNDNFVPVENGPAHNAGTSLTNQPTTDIQGFSWGGTPSIGAYEFDSVNHNEVTNAAWSGP